jgi:hypothetical protein
VAENLEDLLLEYTQAALLAMASFQGLKLPGAKKPDLVRSLVKTMTDPKRVLDTYEELPKAPRAVVDMLLRSGGYLGTATIRQKLTARGLIDNPSSNSWRGQNPDHRNPRSHKLEDILAYLTACGLVIGHQIRDTYNNGNLLDFHPAMQYCVPEAVRACLPRLAPEPSWAPQPAPEPVRKQESSARAFQRDLYLYWSYLNQNSVDLTAKGLVTKRHLVAINNVLLVKENIQTGDSEANLPRLAFLRAILEELGLLQVGDDGTLRALPASSFFALRPQERIQRTLETYVSCKSLNELLWSNRIQGFSQIPTLPAPPLLPDARRALLLHLKTRVPGWLKIDQVVDRIREQQYEFLFSRETTLLISTSYYGVHPYNAQYNPAGWQFSDIYDDASGWERVEANLIRAVIHRPLWWMGLVDVGWLQDNLETPDVFRLTGPGAWLLSGGPEPEIPAEGGQVIVQPDYTITAFDPISDAVLHELDQFAQRISAERAIQFRLTQASVYNGQLLGWNAGSIQAALEQRTGQPLPANVVRTLQDWQSQHERIRILTDVAIVHAVDVQDLDYLEKDPQLSPWLQNRPVANIALLAIDKKNAAFYNLLLKKGWLPLETVGPQTIETVAGAIDLDADGRLTFRVRSPDLYLHGFLSRFADPDGPDAYRLTPASIRRAAASGIPAPQIIEELQQLLAQAIPANLRARILAWAGHYGQAVLEDTHLLIVKDARTAEELLKDPELGDLLHPIRPSDVHTMLQVRTKDLERARRLLAERGVEIKRREA